MKTKKLFYSACKYFLNKKERSELKQELSVVDFSPVSNEFHKISNSILFVIPAVTAGSGGLTSLLRIGKACAENGWQVFYYDYTGGDINQEKKNAKINLASFAGEFLSPEEVGKKTFDFVVASNWQSVYFAKKIPGYKVYFIQDYEPYFYPYSDNYFLAKKTYELGFHLISLGPWNLEQINKNASKGISLREDSLDFPYNPDEYPYTAHPFQDYPKKKEFDLAVYIKLEPKRMPNLVQAILNQAVVSLKEKGYQLNIHYFGLNPKYKVEYGTNHGKLGKEDLLKLYQQCDFGLVASMTNVSLVPYEMLGTGLPIFEFKDGTFASFLGEDTATLIDLSSQSFTDNFLRIVSNPSILEHQIQSFKEKTKSLSWDNSCDQFVNILKRIEQYGK